MENRHFFDRDYLKRVGICFIVSAVSIGFILYILYHALSSAKNDFSSVYSERTSYSDTIECDSYIFRDEVVLKTDSGVVGTPSSVVGEGGKASAGEKVADIYSSYDKSVWEKIEILEEQIKFYERYSSRSGYGKTESVDDAISENIASLSSASYSGSVKKAKGYRDTLLIEIMKREVMTGQINDFDGTVSELEAELENLKSVIGSSIGSVYAPEGGYYFTDTDGYEGIFTSDIIDGMTYSDFTSLLTVEPKSTYGNAGKLIGDYRWYVACTMSDSDARRLTEGKKYTVTLDRNTLYPTEMTLYRTVTNGEDCIAIFRCDRITEGFDYTRMQEATVTVYSGECFRIPVSALRQYDGETGVYVLDRVTVEFRRINIIREENGYVLVSLPGDEEDGEHPWLRENETVIVTGTGLSVGMIYSP